VSDDSREERTIKTEAGTIFFMFMIFFLNMLSRLAFAPFLPGIENELSLNHTETGALFLFISLGYGTGLFCSTLISTRLNHHRQVVLSSILVGVSFLLLSLSESILTLRIILPVLGFSGGLYLPSSVVILTSLVRNQDWGKVFSIHQLAPGLAYISSPLFANLLPAHFTWRFAIAVYGVASVLMGVIFFKFCHLEVLYGKAPSFKVMHRLMKNPSFLMIILLFSLALSINQGFFSIVPLYLAVERALDSDMINKLLIVSRVVVFGVPLLAGWASDTYGLKKTLYVTLLTSGMAIVLVAIVPAGWIGFSLIMQATTSVCLFPLVFAALSHITSQQDRNIAVAVAIPIGHFIGAGMTPSLIGFSGDTGRFSTGIIILGVITASGIVLAKFLKINRHEAT
jgi:MFS transporter, NNP family, nitrate/nitrite transporter